MAHVPISSAGLSSLSQSRNEVANRIASRRSNCKHSYEMSAEYIFKGKYERNVIKYSLMILLYIYGNHEGIVDKGESKSFKKIFNKHKHILSDDDLQELLKHTERVLSQQDLIDYADNNKFSDKLRNDSIEEIKKHCLKKYDYIRSLDNLVINIKMEK